MARPRKEQELDIARRAIDETIRLLSERGDLDVPLTAVAHAIGCTAPALYGHFRNKEELWRAAADRVFRRFNAELRQALERNADKCAKTRMAAMIRAYVHYAAKQPALHKVIIEQVPREGKLADALGISQRLGEMLFDDLRQRYTGLDPQRVRLAAFVLETTIEALTHRAVIEGPNWLKTGQIQKEAHALLGPYLVALGE